MHSMHIETEAERKRMSAGFASAVPNIRKDPVVRERGVTWRYGLPIIY